MTPFVGLGIALATELVYLASLGLKRTKPTWIFDVAMLLAVAASLALRGEGPWWPTIAAAALLLIHVAATRKELTLPRIGALRVKPEDTLPAFSATTTNGKNFTERDLAARAPAMLVTYRGGWCPYCVTQLRDLEDAYDRLRAAGIAVFALSVDTPDEQRPLETRLRDRVVFLSDTSGAFLDTLGVRHPDGIPWYDRLLFKLTRKDIAMPATIVVDAAGRVIFAERARRIDQRPPLREILRKAGRPTS